MNIIPEKVKKYSAYIAWGLGCVYATILFWLNFRRIFDNNFWGDEVFTIRLSRMTFTEMLTATANDVHPPLYYIITMLLRTVFGESGEMYHTSALLAYVVVIITAMTFIWVKWGGHCSVILITCASFLPRAVEYNVEARMYSWGSAFILLAFLHLYFILKDHYKKNYVYYTLFSLCAAYTHYYCIVSIAFFYLVLCIWAFVYRKKEKEVFKNTVITVIITILAYLPWMIILIQTFARTNQNYWIKDIPDLSDCFKYFFSGRIEKNLLLLFLILSIVYFIYTLGKKPPRFFMAEWLWYGAGILSMVGTILTGIAVSWIFRPMFLLRYLYPVSVIAWFLMGIAISHYKGRWIYAVIIAIYIIRGNMQSYMNLYNGNHIQNEVLKDTLDMTAEITDGDIVYTDYDSIVWGVGAYYYPGTSFKKLVTSDVFPELSEDHDYYFMVAEPFEEEYIRSLEMDGNKIIQLVQEGIIGTYTVNIYKLEQADKRY